MPYIYKITNKINNKVYIGQTSSSIDYRWQTHIHDSKKAECQNRPLYRAFHKYGIENFTVEEIEECNSEIVNEREIYWINYYNSYKEGYNATLGGEGRPLADYNLIYELWKKGCNRTEIIRQTNYDIGTITRALKGYGVSDEELIKRQWSSCNKSVAKIDKNTLEIIQIYPSIASAEKEYGIPRGKSHISQVCNGYRQTTLGYKWKFI